MLDNRNLGVSGQEPQPYIYVFRPAAAVAAGATATVSLTNGPRQFVITDIGFTSAPVGIPAAGPPFTIFMQDTGRQVFWSNAPFNILALSGQNPFINDRGAFKLPVPFTWLEQGQYLVNLTNVGTLPSTPELQLIGFLR